VLNLLFDSLMSVLSVPSLQRFGRTALNKLHAVVHNEFEHVSM
jgi:hypothetical protein